MFINRYCICKRARNNLCSGVYTRDYDDYQEFDKEDKFLISIDVNEMTDDY